MIYHKIILPKEDLKISTDQRLRMKGKSEDGCVIYGTLNSNGSDTLCTCAFIITKVNISNDITITFRLLNTNRGIILSENLSNVQYEISKDSENNFISVNATI